MNPIDPFLEQAQMRAKQAQFPYTGALQPQEAYAVLTQDERAILLDVRSLAELHWVGVIPGVRHIEWRFYPDMQINPHFLTELNAQVDKNAVLMMICRSGARSAEAAMAAASAGYSAVYNVLEGFEGDKNALGQRGLVNGWKARNLPWTNL